ncbi:hypothetical protein JH26_24190 [Microvirga sp. BSC39]|nr:hypothetical protein JH26_24190 [Microvirga sp. BSC39]
MPTDDEVKALAMQMVREIITRTGWYPDAPRSYRAQIIEADVEANWTLFLKDAYEHLRKREKNIVPDDTDQA